MGADNHGQTQFPWDSPFQDPYQNGLQGPQEGSGGAMGEGMSPDMGMGFGPPMGGFQGAQDMGGEQPQQGPSLTGVWGDQDLINDPAYSQQADTAHPKWNRFLQYMNTPEAKDSMMLGVIMAQSSTDPMGALKLAQQFREHQAQRQFQAQQNQMNRDAQEQNIKLRSEYMKQQKDEASQRTMFYKADQARKDLVNEGKEAPPMPDDPAEMPVYMENLRGLLGDAKNEKKLKVEGDKKRGRAFSEAYKTGVAPDEYKDDPMVQAAAQVYLDRKAREDERLDLAKTREAQMVKIRGDKNLKPEVTMQARRVDGEIKRADRTISRYEQNIASIEGNGLYPLLPDGNEQKSTFDRIIKGYQDKIDKEEEKRLELEDKWDELVNTRGEAKPGSSGTKPGTAIKDVVAQAPSTLEAETGGEAGEPDEDAVEGYKAMAATEGEAKAKSLWDQYYKGKPYPKVD